MLYPAGVPSSFVTSSNSPSLSVGFSVYDNSGSNPVKVLGPVLMANIPGTNAYQTKYTPPLGNFITYAAVYTDNTLTTVDSDFEQDVQTITAVDFGFNVPVNSIVGYVVPDDDVDGVVNC